MNRLKILFILFTLFIFSSVFADETGVIQVSISEPKPGVTARSIEGLEIQTKELLEEKNQSGENIYSVKITAKLAKTDWRILRGSSVFSPDTSGNLSLVFAMTSKTEELTLYAISPMGEMESSTYLILITNWDQLHATDEDRKWRYNVGVGMTQSSYREGSLGTITQMATYIKGGVVYNLQPKKWNLGLSGYYNFLPLSHSPSTVEAAKYYGINARLGYRLDHKILGFDPIVSLGWYYWGMLTSGVPYGIQSMFGPQFFFSGKRELENKKYFSLYIKYAPIIEKIGLPNPLNNELALGAAYTLFNSWKYGPLNLNLDFSHMNVKISESGREVSLFTGSLGLSKEF